MKMSGFMRGVRFSGWKLVKYCFEGLTMAGGVADVSKVRVATFNVHGFADDHGAASFHRILGSVGRNAPDILFLQETSGRMVLDKEMTKLEIEKGEKPLKCLEAIKEVTPLKFAAVMPGSFCGNGIYSKYLLEHVKIVNLPNTRYAVFAVAETELGPLPICCTHLDHVFEPTRIEQYHVLLDEIREWKKSASLADDVAVLMGGDFNALRRATYDDEEWKKIVKTRERTRWELPQSDLLKEIISDGFLDAGEHGSNTSTIDKTGTCRFDTRIDYLFTHKDLGWKVVPKSYHVDTKTDGSDHRLVRADFIKE